MQNKHINVSQSVHEELRCNGGGGVGGGIYCTHQVSLYLYIQGDASIDIVDTIIDTCINYYYYSWTC